MFGSASAAQAKTNSMITPVVFVIGGDKNAKPNTLAGGHSQKITQQISVLVAVTNKTGDFGFSAEAEIETIEAELMMALCAWQPNYAANPVDFVADNLIGFDEYTLRHAFVFVTSYYYRK